MSKPIFQVDAFATQRFKGNPAAVMPMGAFPTDEVLQSLAAENNLPETAFIVRQESDYALRWFTPTVEVPLCGHATLASAAVVMERLEPSRDEVVFHSQSGPLTVRRAGTGYAMDFPARRCEPITLPAGLAKALGVEPIDVAHDGFNYLAQLESEELVRDLAPDIAAIARLDVNGVIVTAKGRNGFDIVSRYFAPAKGIPEDPVTGGAHCALAPYWVPRLGKAELHALQASARGGELHVRLIGDRVELQGSCVFYLEGHVQY
jgi:PhzF family phenazine biosynthesis protein